MTPVPVQLVARADLLDELRAVVGDAPQHGSTVVALTGAPGAGRTALLRALTASLEAEDVGVFLASAVPWEHRHSGAVLHHLLPDLETLSADPFEAADAVLEALVGARRAAGKSPGPTVLVVDDAHHAHSASLQTLCTLARHHPTSGIVVILSHPSRRRRLGPDEDVLDSAVDATFVVPPLSGSEVVQVAAQHGLSLRPSSAERLARHTGGRAGPVIALLESLPPETWRDADAPLPAPPAVMDVVRRQLDACGPDTRALVEGVATLAQPAAVAAAAGLAGVEEPTSPVADAEVLGLLVMAEASHSVTLRLPDPMTRAAVLSLMGTERRTSLHRTAADLVEDPGEALAHAVEASLLPDPDLADRLESLALDRGSRGEWAAASRLLLLASRATSESPLRGNRLIGAVDALVGAGDVPGAGAYIAEVESLPETPMRNAVLGYLAILKGRPHEAEARLERAWQTLRPGREPAVAAVICHRQVLHHLARCDGAGLVTWADRAVDLVGPDHPTAVEAQAIRGLGLGSTGRTEEALESYRRLFTHASNGAVGQRVQMGAGWLHLATDRIDAARTELETAVPTDFLGGSSRISLWAQAWLARTHFATGDWDAALSVVRSAQELADRSGSALVVPLVQWTATQVHALRGDWAAADESLRRGAAGAREYAIMRVPSSLARAGVAEARADYAGVLRALHPLTGSWASQDVSEPGFWPWPDVYANALVVEGRLDEAQDFLAPHEARARAGEHHSAMARLGYARGRLLGARGDLPGARRSFLEALELLSATPLVYDRARVNFAFGQTLRRAGKRREADDVISAAREAYLAIGATTYVRRCDRELRAGGVHAVLRDRPAHALTPQEEAVAGLVATGLSNREAASELFLSVKTVQFHLTRVYAKLGIRSRTELAALRAGSPSEEGV